MSVINDMLNDLERRHYLQTPASAGTDFHQYSAVGTTHGWMSAHRWLIGLLGIAVLAGGAGYAIFRLYPAVIAPASHPAAPQVSAPSDFALPPLVEPTTSPQPAMAQTEAQSVAVESTEPRLKQVDLNDRTGRFDLDLHFDKALIRPLLHFRKDDHLWVRLFPAEVSQVELPELPPAGAILAWEAYVEDGFQMLSLRVDPSNEVELKHLGSKFWRLTLQPAPAPSEPVPAAQTLAKPDKFTELPEKPVEPSQATVNHIQTESVPRVKRSLNRYRAAEQALAQGKRNEAQAMLETLLAKQPGHLRASLLLGKIHLETSRFKSAETVIQTALQRHGKQTQLVSYMTRSLMGQERLTEAADFLEPNMQRDLATHLGLLAVIRQRQGQHREASHYYREALEQRPDEVTWLAGLAISEEQQGSLATAQQAYRRALASERLSPALKSYVTVRLDELEGL